MQIVAYFPEERKEKNYEKNQKYELSGSNTIY